MHRETWQRRSAVMARATLGLAALGLLVHAAWIAGLGAGTADLLINDGIYNAVLVLSALTCLLRAAGRAPERFVWLAFGLGLAAWAAADIYWTVALADVKHPPYPSLADVGYLLAYPCMYVGVLLLVRQRVRFSIGGWLDGAIGGLAAAALATAALAPALVGLTKGDPAVVATNLAYPLGDVLLLSFLIAGFAVAGVRVGRSWLLVGLGLVAWGIADPIYLYQEATGAMSVAIWTPSGSWGASRSPPRRCGTRRRAQGANRTRCCSRPCSARSPSRSCLGPLRAHRGGLGLARGSDARGRCRSAADQLPGEPKAFGGPCARRRHRRAHRARQPPPADRDLQRVTRARRPGRRR